MRVDSVNAVDAVRRSRAPSLSIASAVHALFVYEPEAELPHVGIPRPEVDVVVRFGPSARGGLDAHALGARERLHRKVPRGVQRTLTARLRLGATEAVLGVPASHLTGRVVPLEDLWGGAATRGLFERLTGARDMGEASAVLEDAIGERLASANARRVAPSLVADAVNKLGGASVNAVASELGVSDRHLRRIFLETVGLTPKAFAKVARFRRALHAALEERSGGWASIALRAGYYDQAHLISDFRAITGTTPGALLRELRTAPTIR